ncbi:MAG: hypothetical protein JNL04_03580 [Rhodospirillaceae bacterium]|nr:hypothetical protein [Rhodospirillaceae bacterium]
MLRSRIEAVEAVEAETSHTFSRHTHETFGIGVCLVDVLATELGAAWQAPFATAILDSSQPRFGF